MVLCDDCVMCESLNVIPNLGLFAKLANLFLSAVTVENENCICDSIYKNETGTHQRVV